MSNYRCYFVNSADHIVGVEDIVARTDVEAVKRARALMTCPVGCTVEVWEDSRLVQKNIWPNAPAQCA